MEKLVYKNRKKHEESKGYMACLSRHKYPNIKKVKEYCNIMYFLIHFRFCLLNMTYKHLPMNPSLQAVGKKQKFNKVTEYLPFCAQRNHFRGRTPMLRDYKPKTLDPHQN